jgi:inositol oxygenase
MPLPDSLGPAEPGPLEDLDEWESFLVDRYPEPGKKTAFREYSQNVRPAVREFYRLKHTHQAVDVVRTKRTAGCAFRSCSKALRDAGAGME